MVSYELHEFYRDKIITGEIDPNKIVNVKYISYDRNDKGLLILDKNKDLQFSKSFYSLATKKCSQEKFNQIVDIEFKDFADTNINSGVTFLENRLASLQAIVTKTNAEKEALAKKVESLNLQIQQLQQTQFSVSVTPDTTFTSSQPVTNVGPIITSSSPVTYV